MHSVSTHVLHTQKIKICFSDSIRQLFVNFYIPLHNVVVIYLLLLLLFQRLSQGMCTRIFNIKLAINYLHILHANENLGELKLFIVSFSGAQKHGIGIKAKILRDLNLGGF